MNGYVHVFTTLADPASRFYVTVNPDDYDRSQPKSAPQHMLVRLRHGNATLLNSRPSHQVFQPQVDAPLAATAISNVATGPRQWSKRIPVATASREDFPHPRQFESADSLHAVKDSGEG